MNNIEDQNPNKKNCSGCTACQQVCPVHCIQMHEDLEGFLYPKVNKDACIDCGKCIKTCPWLNVSTSEEKNIPTVIAVKHKDTSVRQRSTSGGAFTALAKSAIKRGGIVFGAAYNKSTKRVEHIAIDKQDNLYKLRGSKYVQSYLGDTFLQVKAFLLQERFVVFTGTPCQCDGLRHFLRRDYLNLIIIDILCHSVPSPKVLKAIIDRIDEPVTNISFRDKKRGWRNSYHFEIFTDSGKIVENKSYLTFFFRGVMNRPSCYNCHYTSTNRVGDITLGDYWNINRIDHSFEDSLGVSCVLINNNKGNSFFNEVKNCLNTKETELSPALQDCMVKNVKEPVNRTEFWKYFNEKGLATCENKWGRVSFWDKIKGLVRFLIKKILLK